MSDSLVIVYEELCAAAAKKHMTRMDGETIVDLELAEFVRNSRRGGDLSARFSIARQRMFAGICKELDVSFDVTKK